MMLPPFSGKCLLLILSTTNIILSASAASSTTTIGDSISMPISSETAEASTSPLYINKTLRGSDRLNKLSIVSFSRHLATISSNSNPSGTGWVGLQAITAFFVIIAVVAFALFLRPTTINRSQYQPV